MQLARLLSLAIVAGAFGLGCSSSSTGGVITPIKDTGVVIHDSTPVADTGTTTTPPVDSGTPPTGCDVDAGTGCTTAACGDSNTCFQCYATGDTAGYTAYVTALTGACACATGSTCYSACKSTDVCGGAATDHSACITCVNGLASSDACIATFQTKCKADSNCVAFANGANTACP